MAIENGFGDQKFNRFGNYALNPNRIWISCANGNVSELRLPKTKVARTTAHAARDTCCSKVDADMVSCVRRISARESKKASVDSAP
jgi:hypothetical protein